MRVMWQNGDVEDRTLFQKQKQWFIKTINESDFEIDVSWSIAKLNAPAIRDLPISKIEFSDEVRYPSHVDHVRDNFGSQIVVTVKQHP